MIFIPQVNSTNIYATQRISDGLSVHGEVVWTHHQTAGRGQRSKQWSDEVAKSVLMSVVLLENLDKMQLFQVNAIVALAVRKVIAAYVPEQNVCIKWPNDIFINDKKTCGILIENSFRGAKWYASVVGIGVNVMQEGFSEELPHATSIFLASGMVAHIEQMVGEIQLTILSMFKQYVDDREDLLVMYNEHLYKRGLETSFVMEENGSTVKAVVLGVDADGRLELEIEDRKQSFQFGRIQWVL